MSSVRIATFYYCKCRNLHKNRLSHFGEQSICMYLRLRPFVGRVTALLQPSHTQIHTHNHYDRCNALAELCFVDYCCTYLFHFTFAPLCLAIVLRSSSFQQTNKFSNSLSKIASCFSIKIEYTSVTMENIPTTIHTCFQSQTLISYYQPEHLFNHIAFFALFLIPNLIHPCSLSPAVNY